MYKVYSWVILGRVLLSGCLRFRRYAALHYGIKLHVGSAEVLADYYVCVNISHQLLDRNCSLWVPVYVL